MSYNTKDYLAICFATVDHFGYISSADAPSKQHTTWYTAKMLYDYTHYEPIENLEYYEKLVLKMDLDSFKFSRDALDSLNWIKFKYDGNSEYLLKLKSIFQKVDLEEKDLPIVASFPKAWEGVKEELFNTSNFVGQIGENIKVKVEDYKRVGGYSSQFGYVYIHQFKDIDGNIFIWKTGIIIDDVPNYIEGKVKEHNEYKGIKQTILTRCKIS